jgi:imidazolonepropionase
MLKILKDSSQIVTVNTNGKNIKRGKEQSNLDVLTDHSIIIEDDIIKDIVPNYSLKNISNYELISLKNKTVFPGFIECHTHTVYTGSRANEFKLRLKGASYEEIANSGGGIKSTVNAVRNSSFDDLVIAATPRIRNFISQGITTLEIKSGYGLDFENEIKLLEVINHLNKLFPIGIIATFLGAHTYPDEFKKDHEGYIELLINKIIPAAAKKKLAVFCDVFCESTAFSAKETDRILNAAKHAGLKIKIHTEQFNNIGGLEVALKNDAISVEHLEMMKDDQIANLAAHDTVAVLLPGVSYFLNYRYAPARKLIDENVPVAIATDFNPGSSHISNISLIMSLAAINLKMSIEEVISAYTINAACALNINNRTGSIEPGKKADFAVIDSSEYSDIIYNTGTNLNIMTIKDGKIIFGKTENR